MLGALLGMMLTACEAPRARSVLVTPSTNGMDEACLCDLDKLDDNDDAEQWLAPDHPRRTVKYVKLSDWRPAPSVKAMEASKAKAR